MRFTLTKKTSNRAQTTFHVLDSQNSIVGSINVPNEQAEDMLKHWSGPTGAAPAPKAKAQTLIDAFKKQATVMTR